MRRQYRSCDQCRRSKRACDAPPMWDTLENYIEGELGTIDSDADIDCGETVKNIILNHYSDITTTPCSYCARTSKACTYDWVIQKLREKYGEGASAETFECDTDVNSPVSSIRSPEPSTREPMTPLTAAKGVEASNMIAPELSDLAKIGHVPHEAGEMSGTGPLHNNTSVVGWLETPAGVNPPNKPMSTAGCSPSLQRPPSNEQYVSHDLPSTSLPKPPTLLRESSEDERPDMPPDPNGNVDLIGLLVNIIGRIEARGADRQER